MLPVDVVSSEMTNYICLNLCMALDLNDSCMVLDLYGKSTETNSFAVSIVS